MANANQKQAIKRLMFDQEELRLEPVANVSAAPLDEDMFEWHCNIKQDDIIFHLILFFPKDYPYSSPSAEFVPVGFSYNSGATMPGKKGTKICLNIFSDFANIHTEWKNTKGAGWSPGYTVQTVLMNVVAFLAETQSSSGSSSTYNNNLKMSKSFSCKDCGHTYNKPYPELDTIQGLPPKGKGKGKTSKDTKVVASADAKKGKDEEVKRPQIIDYISKEIFKAQKPGSVDDLFGYGLVVSGTNWRPTLTSPCEFITGRSFYGMKKAVNVVHSVLKEELKLFLPLFIHPDHGSEIKNEFEKTMKEVAKIMPKYDPSTSSIEELVLKTIPNLMSATVVEFSKGTQHTSDNSLNGYFALHRLLLWAIDTYPKLQDMIERQVQEFVENDNKRTKKDVPYIAEWLMLVGGSQKYRWRDVAEAYLSESFKRSPMWYVKDDEKLGYLDTPKEYRIKKTFDLTEVARKHLAFQASFLDLAMPAGMTRQAIIQRYDSNLGFPTKEIVLEMKEIFTKIETQMKNYQDWFKILKLPTQSDDELHKKFVDAVKFSILHKSYHWSSYKTGGGWGAVLTKYADMIKEHKNETSEDAEGSAEGNDKSKAKKKSDDKAVKGADKNQSKGSANTKGSSKASAAAAGRGRKRKVEPVDEDDVDDVGPKAGATGRGRGKGGAAKKRR
ncbi:ubiquitin-conjugating enzyme e2 6 [Plakobranchus ocellatus]|uniref:Ubiquitin-conjugating enzyme e2 6 n=1 Tax=Plakobranchus ocellatus TaxID=259542 RepID=A0AAV4E2L7_9GAST|nr:ubiquitin-conjugating enzyme e2 6 [Plakobranchus ocellatus]